MDTSPNKRISYRMEIVVAVGYVLLFCLIFGTCYAFYVAAFLKPNTLQSLETANLPPLTPTPHISSTFPEHCKQVF